MMGTDSMTEQRPRDTIKRLASTRLETFSQILELIRPMLPEHFKAIDLGCGHCLFMDTAADQGFDVYGLDAREERVPAKWRERVTLGRVQDADLAPYDCIFCLGIYYHLTLEDQLAMVAKFSGRPAIVDTHYCSAAPSKTLMAGGQVYAGRDYAEGTALTSSYNDPVTFWPTEPDLIRILGQNHQVMKWLPEHYPGRSFYLLIPKGPRC